jgi:amicyanin
MSSGGSMKLVYIVILVAVLAFFSGSAQAADVSIKDYRFQPAQVTIPSGETVTWTNMDAATHDVKFSGFESPDLKINQQFTKTFDKPGTYDYICELHPGMKGTVIVK